MELSMQAGNMQEPEYNLPLPSHGSSSGSVFQNGWDPPLLLAVFLKQCLDLTDIEETRKQISCKQFSGLPLSLAHQSLRLGLILAQTYSALPAY